MRVLAGHRFSTITYIAGNHEDEAPWSHTHPYLPNYHNVHMELFSADACLSKCDVVFVALPSGRSGGVAADLWRHGQAKIVDLSGDLRLPAREYREWYGLAPCADEALEAAVYGLTEWNRPAISTAKLIANPGCYATAVLLALRPLAVLEPLKSARFVVVDAKSGVSGAGRKPSESLLFGELQENFYPYKVGTHQHTPEIQRFSHLDAPILLTTHLLPIVRGIYASIYLTAETPLTNQEIYQVYQDAYADERFIHVYPPGDIPQLKHVRGSNSCHIGFSMNVQTGVLQVFSVIDNLQKGAAGQAVQNMNVAMGFREDEGLTAVSLYP